MPRARVSAITLDVSDLDRSVAFWGSLLGLKEVDRYQQYVWLDDVAPGVSLILQQVDDLHVSKNRMHFELASPDADTVIARVQQLGGARLTDVEDPVYALTVMTDPDGNEFCVSRRPSPAMAQSAGKKPAGAAE